MYPSIPTGAGMLAPEQPGETHREPAGSRHRLPIRRAAAQKRGGHTGDGAGRVKRPVADPPYVSIVPRVP